MDKKKRLRRDRLQNFLILALSISAVYLFFLTGSLELELPTISLSPSTEQELTDSTALLQELDFPATLVVSDGHSRLYRQLSTSDSAFTSVEGLWEDLFREGFTSFTIPYTDFQSALSLPGIYVSFPNSVPLCILSERLGLPSTDETELQRLLLVTEGEDVRFYHSDGNHYHLSYTSLTASEVLATAEVIGGSSCSFAFEQSEPTLHPLTVLPAELPQYPEFGATTATELSDLLSFFGFNTHTTSRYVDSTGTEVIMESSRKLSIAPDGRLSYLGSTSYAPNGFTLSTEPDPPLPELVDSTYRLLTQLCGDTAPRFYLSDVNYNRSSGTCTLRFSRMAGGLPLLSGDGEAAAEFLIRDGIVVSCSYLCRSYTPSDTPALLLPLRQATAIATQYEGMELALSYVDNGGDSAAVSWLMR